MKKSNNDNVMTSGYVRVADDGSYESTTATGLSAHDFLWEKTASDKTITLKFTKPVQEEEPAVMDEYDNDHDHNYDDDDDDYTYIISSAPSEEEYTNEIYSVAAREMMDCGNGEHSEIIFLYRTNFHQNWTDLKQVAVVAKKRGEYFNVNIVTTDDSVFYSRVSLEYLEKGLRDEMESYGIEEKILLMYDRIINRYTSNKKC